MKTHEVTGAAREVGDSKAVEMLARVGYAASGVLHLVLAWIALQIAWGGSGGGRSADQSGALGILAENAFGRILLWVLTIGFFGLSLWQLTEAVVGGRETSDRVKAAAKFVMYAALGWTSLTFARGGSGSSKGQTQDVTAKLMSQPFGQVLVGLVGVGVLGVAGYHVYKGWKKKFLEDLTGHPGTFATNAGRAGYIAKGIALAVVGALFVLAALHANSQEATGLDGAVRTLGNQPFGQVLLTLVGLGLAAYGVYSFARAKHAKV